MILNSMGLQEDHIQTFGGFRNLVIGSLPRFRLQLSPVLGLVNKLENMKNSSMKIIDCNLITLPK